MEHVSLPEELHLVVGRARGVLLTQDIVDLVLPLLVDAVLATVPGSDSCSITVLDGASQGATTAPSDDLAARADELQYTHGDGPCLEAIARRIRTVVHDVRDDDRWPQWAHELDVLGFRSLLSVPMVAGDRVLGAVKVYGRAPRAFDVHSERILSLTAAQAAVLVAAARQAERGRSLGADLKAALRRRDVVNTARGVLVQRDHVDEDGATALLATMAARDGRPMHQVARALVDTAVRRRS